MSQRADARAAPIVVVGAGAAGFMAAIFAAAGTRPVVLLERTRDGGRKILISGGGRCNVLPSQLQPTQYVTESSPNTLRKMLLTWPLVEQQRWFEHDLAIPLTVEAATGKMFPVSNHARDVRDRLVDRCRQRGVAIRFDATVEDLTPAAGGVWQLRLRGGDVLDASSVIMATGGLSVPNTGSDGTGLRMLKALGHTIHTTYPALTPLTAEPHPHADLAGISLDVTIDAPATRGFSTRGGFLITHRGYSGPAVLDISHIPVRARMEGRRQPLLVRWTGEDSMRWDDRLREGGAAAVGTVLRRALPTRLADRLLHDAGVDPQRTLATLRREERSALVSSLARYELPVTGDEGYRKAEVTGGGVSLAEVDPLTLESRLHSGLFLCGELLDAFGPIGGYNFAWAWATGRSAGIGAARRH